MAGYVKLVGGEKQGLVLWSARDLEVNDRVEPPGVADAASGWYVVTLREPIQGSPDFMRYEATWAVAG